jgi:GTPase SAR1 family protein
MGTASSFISLRNKRLQDAINHWEKEHNKKGKSVTFDVIGIDEFDVSPYMPLQSILQETGEDGIVIVFHLDSKEKEKIDVSKHNVDLKKEMMGCNVSA